jgi:hypothetical protein
MAIPIVKPTLAELQKGIARFSELKGVTTGIPDMKLPEYHRAFLNVLGFSQPKGGVGEMERIPLRSGWSWALSRGSSCSRWRWSRASAMCSFPSRRSAGTSAC